MKIKTTFLYLFLIVFLFSCEDKLEAEITTIDGKWNVSQIIGGFAKAKNYKEGSFTWTFNFDNNTITIVNNADVFTALDVPTFINNQGGIYTFEIITENDFEYLLVGERKGAIKLENNKLRIDYGIAFDDIAYTFKK
jgi:hypothetical protein